MALCSIGDLLMNLIDFKLKSKCTAYFLLDRIRFQQKQFIGIKPFRKEVIYREIKHFFIFPNYPELFMICIIDESKHKRSYELYQCINYNDVCTVCNLTYKASIDMYNILHEKIPLRHITLSTRSSLIDHYSTENFNYPTSNNQLNETNEDRNMHFTEPLEDNIDNNHEDENEQVNSNILNMYSTHTDRRSNLSIHTNKSNRQNGKQIIKTKLIESTSNLPTTVNQSSISYNSKLNHSKFFSTNNLYTNRPRFTSEQMNSVKGDESSEYCIRKQQTNCSSSHITQQNTFLGEVIINKLHKRKSYTTSSFSSTSSGEYDINENICAKQDMSSINHNEPKLQNSETNSTFLSWNLNQPASSSSFVDTKKSFTLARGNNLFSYRRASNVYEDDQSFKRNGYGPHNDSDDKYFENKLRKCISNVDILSADTTYLYYDPVVGIRINNKGPVYMYMARYNCNLISTFRGNIDLESY
ncbi:hypothetical protein MN116_002272 [Schistosoma mekongi]|uniref:Trematode PH-like domain-containing protein n=1 Tax=Schistosoma mekongi TaxID=38744 RepID=A0AAE1ZJ51_SCHME|nr:hypothetical protein MN116_002272 [Schistosoma mekongi]